MNIQEIINLMKVMNEQGIKEIDYTTNTEEHLILKKDVGCLVPAKISSGVVTMPTEHTIPVTSSLIKRNFNKESRALKNKQGPQETQSDKINCPTCGGLTTSDDIQVCSVKDCTTITCSNCGTQTKTGRLCEKHWKEL